MKKNLLRGVYIILLLYSQIIVAQSKTVIGTVNDDTGLPLPGANVIIKGTNTGTQTDFDGNYSIKANVGQIIVFSYVGYLEQEFVITATTSTANITLLEDTSALEEVVVVGYGSIKKRNLTDAVAKVTSNDIKEVPNSSFQNALVGKLPGVQIQQANGKADGRVTFTVRGVASVSGNQDPLFVVDGIPIISNQESNGDSPSNPLININPNDIESIQILKDASSAAIYGSRGTNGVVLITTKRGKDGKMKVTFNSSYGVSEATNTRKFLNAAQYVELYIESRLNSGLSMDAIENQLDNLATDSNGYTNDWRNGEVDTNWTDLALVEGTVQENNISVSGGTEKSQFYMSLGQNKTESIVRGNELERYNFRLNAQTGNTDKFIAGANITINKSELDRIAGDNSFLTPLQAIAQIPISSPYNQDGTINNGTIYANFLREDANAFYNTNVWNLGGKLFAEYFFIPELSLRSELGYEHFEQLEETFRGPDTDFQGQDNGQATARNVNRDFYAVNNYFTFNKLFKDTSNLNFVLGMSYEYNRRKSQFVSGIDFANPTIQTLLGAGTIDDGNSRRSQNNLISYFSRATFDYKGKYLLKGSLRVDGSSQFGFDSRYGFFPAASVGWIASNESFLSNSNFISNLKLRGSIGITGNRPLLDFEYLSLTNSGAYGGVPFFNFGEAGDPNLQWEDTVQYNAGIDYGIFNNRISGEIDYYVKDTQQLLLNTPVSLVNGIPTSNIFGNSGSIQNTGVEFSLNTRNITTENFTWNTNFNLAYNKNEVTELPNNDDDIISGSNIVRVGETFASFYLVEYAGVDPANGDALYYLNTELPDGTLDRTTTNVFNDAERVVLGSPFPDITTGMTNTFVYKNLDLSITFQGQYGASIYNSGGRFQQASFAFQDNPGIEELDRWQNPGDITDVPQLRSDGSNSGGNSSRYLDEADFIRLRNLTIGYNFRDKGPFTSLRIYATGLNLATFTDYGGYDPEATQDDLNSSISRGIEFYSAPPAKTYTIGINAQF